jgi:cytochrome P450
VTASLDQARLPQPPYLAGLPVLGNYLRYKRERLDYLLELRARHGDVVKFRLGSFDLVLAAHPEAVKRVMHTHVADYPKAGNLAEVFGNGVLTTNGESWRRQRKLIQPVFSHRFIQESLVVARDVVDQSLERLSLLARLGHPIDVQRELKHITFRIVVETIVGPGVEDRYQELNAAMDFLGAYLTRKPYRLLPLPDWIPTADSVGFKRSMRCMDEAIYGTMARRRREGYADAPDVVSLLLQAQEADSDGFLDDRQLRDEIATLLFAGYETTAVGISWLLYLLANHPDVQERARAEAIEVMGPDGADPERLSQLDYTGQVIDETLRLYPPGWAWSRSASRPDALSGFAIDEGTRVLICPYVTHRHPEFWDAPEVFDPERFSPQRVQDRHRFAYFPFGAGPRTCVGKFFALGEMKMFCARFLPRFEVLPTDHEPILDPQITLGARDGVLLKIRERG